MDINFAELSRKFWTVFIVFASALLVATQTQAATHSLTFTATADNAYAIYTGTDTSANQNVGNHTPADAAGIYYSESYATTAQDTDWIYIAAWSDDAVQQFLLAEVNNTTTGTTIPSGDSRWQVTATGINLGIGSPAPSLAEITAQIALANVGINPSAGWQSVAANPSANTLPGHAAAARWMWWNNGMQASSTAPFTPGFNHHEYLIFRLPVSALGLEVFISGSSSQQKTIGKIVESFFVTNDPTKPIDVYYDTGTGGNDYRAYSGTAIGTGTALDGKKILVHHRAKGGSVWGVNPVARAEAISRMKVDNTCVSTGGVYPNATYTCSGTVNAVPDAGVSDVEPAMFQGINVAAGDSELTDDERAQLTAASQLAVIFAPTVTDNVSVNLTRAQVNALLSGAYTDWSSIPGAGSGPVTVCRRVDGSGAQAAFNAYFQGVNCSLAPSGPADALASVPGGYTVVESSTSGAVVSCLNNAWAAGKKAIGVLSTENVPVPGTDHWHATYMGGIAPTKINAASGAYDFFVEQTFQWRNTTVNSVPDPTGDMLDFLNTFLARSGDPAIVGSLAGVSALPSLYDPNLYAAGQVMKGTRQGNTCAPTSMYY